MGMGVGIGIVMSIRRGRVIYINIQYNKKNDKVLDILN